MNLQDELFDLIENYLHGDMPEAERLAFEERIARDQSLADKVAETRAANEAIYYASLAEFKNTIGKDLKNIAYKPPVNWKKTGAISIVSLAVIAGLTAYFSTKNTADVDNKKTDAEKNVVLSENTEVKQHTSAVSEKNNSAIVKSAGASLNQEFTDTTGYKKSASVEQHISDPLIKNNPATDNKNSSAENTQPKQTDSKISKNESAVSDEHKNPCDKTFTIHTEASCKGKESGVISIISDGAYTYTFHADIKSTSGTKAVFRDLSAGQHEILVTYGKECTYTKKVAVAEKWCAMNESYSFNPDYNEKWKPLYESGASGSILIYDKLGKEIFSMPFGTGNEEWIGNDRQGVAVAVGVYVAFIQYADGRKEKVELTVIR